MTSTHLQSFTTFGTLLHFLRRRARLTQRELAIAANYSEAHVSRLESGQRIPDMTTLIALIIPALKLDDDPESMARLIELATVLRGESLVGQSFSVTSKRQQQTLDMWLLEPIPVLPALYIEREQVLQLSNYLESERCVIVSGQAGIGTTTLVAAVAHKFKATQPIFWFNFAENNQTDTLICQLAIFLAGLGHENIAILTEVTPEGEANLLLEQKIRLLRAVLQQQNALLCLDNVHTIQHDSAMRRLLEQIAISTKVAIVLISREHLNFSGYAPFKVSGLTDLEGQTLIQHMNSTLDPAVTRQLMQQTAGNPMLMRLAVGQLRFNPHFIDQLAHQPHVTAYIAEHTLKHLSPAAQNLVELLSCLTIPADLTDQQLIQAMFKLNGAYNWHEAVNELMRLHLIDHPSQASLPPLVASYVYAHLTDDQHRNKLHHVLGQWLETTNQHPIMAAEQYFKADDINTATDVLMSAMNRIIEEGHVASAVTLIDAMLPRARQDHHELIVPLLQHRGELLINTEHGEEAERTFREALSLAVKPTIRARLVIRLASCLIQRNAIQEAIDLINTALAKLAPSDTILRAWLLVARSKASLGISKFAEAQNDAEQAIALTEQFDPRLVLLSAEIRARALSGLGIVMMLTGQIETGIRYWQDVIIAAEAAGISRLKPRALFNLASMYLNKGDFANALENYNQAIIGFSRMNDAFSLARIAHALGIIHLMRAEFAQALEQLSRACELKQSIGDYPGWLTSRNELAMALLRMGKLDEARTLAQAVIQDYAQTDFNLAWVNSLDTLLSANLLLNDLPNAQATLAQIQATNQTINPNLQAAITLHEAWLHLLNADIPAANALINTISPTDLVLEQQLEYQVTKALLASLHHDSTAQSQLEAIRDRARASQYEIFARAAERLLAQPPTSPLDGLRSIWYA